MRRFAWFVSPLLLIFFLGCGDQATGPDLALQSSFARGGKKPPKPPPDDGGGEDPSGGLTFVSIETSYHPLTGAFTCAIEDGDADGVGPAYCWGENSLYSLGLGGKNKRDKDEPTDPVGGGALVFSQVELGQLYACGIEDGNRDGKGPIYCWGQNDHGELADGTTTTRSDPAPVASSREFFDLDLGTFGGCALAGDAGAPGEMHCWGAWGGGGGYNPSVPTPVGGDLRFKSLSTNYSTICGIDADDAAWCWGNNEYGVVGNGTISDMELTPQPVSGGHRFQALAVTHTVTCGLTTAGDIYCWGGRSEPEWWQSLVPELMSMGEGENDRPFVDLVRGFCATGASGQVYCWGPNGFGQVGDGSWGPDPWLSWEDQPKAVASPGVFLRMGEKNSHTCGIGVDGFAYCWGYNGSGQLGNGTREGSPIPVKVARQ